LQVGALLQPKTSLAWLASNFPCFLQAPDVRVMLPDGEVCVHEQILTSRCAHFTAALSGHFLESRPGSKQEGSEAALPGVLKEDTVAEQPPESILDEKIYDSDIDESDGTASLSEDSSNMIKVIRLPNFSYVEYEPSLSSGRLSDFAT
jgi:hypothetical protein